MPLPVSCAFNQRSWVFSGSNLSGSELKASNSSITTNWPLYSNNCTSGRRITFFRTNCLNSSNASWCLSGILALYANNGCSNPSTCIISMAVIKLFTNAPIAFLRSWCSELNSLSVSVGRISDSPLMAKLANGTDTIWVKSCLFTMPITMASSKS